jgi:hypothetical protein
LDQFWSKAFVFTGMKGMKGIKSLTLDELQPEDLCFNLKQSFCRDFVFAVIPCIPFIPVKLPLALKTIHHSPVIPRTATFS